MDDDKNLSSVSDNEHSMFLGGVCESDVLEVVRKFKNKKYVDCNNIDMWIVSLSHLLIYVTNLYQLAFFPIK